MTGKALLLAAAAALLPPLAEPLAARPIAAVKQPFAPPESPMVLTRTVWRSLADGKEIMVRRSYAVRFVRQDNGFTLEGRLLDTAVEAPAVLAPLAELERQRGDEGLFPLRLDAAGQIRMRQTGNPASAPERETAVKHAQELLFAAQLVAAKQQEIAGFVSQLARQGTPAAWPADLFNPIPGERRESRKIALPDGEEGEVAVSVSVLGQLDSGLPKAVERTVTTVLAGTARTSREQWTLALAELPNP